MLFDIVFHRWISYNFIMIYVKNKKIYNIYIFWKYLNSKIYGRFVILKQKYSITKTKHIIPPKLNKFLFWTNITHTPDLRFL